LQNLDSQVKNQEEREIKLNDKILKECDNILLNIGNTRIMQNLYKPTSLDMETKLSDTTLSSIQKNGDLPKARHLEFNDNRIIFDFRNPLSNLVSLIEEEIDHRPRPSGFFKYPPNAYCGWHTNSNTNTRKPNRIYLIWAQEDNKSFFRYQDNTTGEIKTNYDIKGWQIKKFKLSSSKESLYWHCVGSQTNRVSLGFAY